MTAKPTHNYLQAKAVKQAVTVAREDSFDAIVQLIDAARRRAYQAVNTALIDLYWQIGEHISRKIAAAEWGDRVVDRLSPTSPARTPASAASRGRTCSACGSSEAYAVADKKSRHC
jgi:hypothetical protein